MRLVPLQVVDQCLVRQALDDEFGFTPSLEHRCLVFLLAGWSLKGSFRDSRAGASRSLRRRPGCLAKSRPARSPDARRRAPFSASDALGRCWPGEPTRLAPWCNAAAATARPVD